MKNSIKLGAVTLAFILAQGASSAAFAEGKIEPAERKYDRKIEAAAIEKAAQKIGELRGSVTGDLISEIISEEDLNGAQMGFPIIEKQRRQQRKLGNAVPMV